MKLPPDVSQIIDTLTSNGHEAYIVGGCVRDSIMGVTPKDWDITTSAKPEQVVDIFPRTFETGIKHGTITVLINRQGYEVTTYRIDGEYLDSRRPQQVTFTTSIEEDLSRRDFTMNAIAYNLSSGFVDPFGGQADISKEIIRCVGSAECRFGEDALRMLRAVRFAGQLGFVIDDEAILAIKMQRENLANISAERIREELTKLIISSHVEALSLLEITGLLPYAVVGYDYPGSIKRTIGLLTNSPKHEAMRWALFLAFSGKAYVDILRGLRFDNKTIREVSLYVSLLSIDIPHSRYEIKKLLRQMSQESKEKCQLYFENLLTLQEIINPHDTERLAAVRLESQDIQTKGECYTLRDLSVNGDDLFAAGVPRGKAMGEKLEELLDEVMRDPSKNAFFRKYFKSEASQS